MVLFGRTILCVFYEKSSKSLQIHSFTSTTFPQISENYKLFILTTLIVSSISSSEDTAPYSIRSTDFTLYIESPCDRSVIINCKVADRKEKKKRRRKNESSATIYIIGRRRTARGEENLSRRVLSATVGRSEKSLGEAGRRDAAGTEEEERVWKQGREARTPGHIP